MGQVTDGIGSADGAAKFLPVTGLRDRPRWPDGRAPDAFLDRLPGYCERAGQVDCLIPGCVTADTIRYSWDRHAAW